MGLFGRKRYQQVTYIEPVRSGGGCLRTLLIIALIIFVLWLVGHVI